MQGEDQDRELLERTFGKKGLLDRVIKENSPEPLEEISVHRLESCLLKIAEIIDDIPDEEVMEHLLEKAGCAKTVYDIGLTEDMIPLSLRLSPYTRRRLSLLRVSKMLDYK